MNNIISFVNFKKVGLVSGVLMLVVASVVLASAPRKIDVSLAQDCASQASQTPRVGVFPIAYNSDGTYSQYAGDGCTDFAPIAVENTNNSGNYQASATANAGDEFSVRVYVHNGAVQDPNDSDYNKAFNVNGNVYVSGSSIGTSFSGSNTNSMSGQVNVNIPQGSTLELVPGSGQFYSYNAGYANGSSNLGSTNGSFNMGDMKSCFEYSKFFVFKVKVVGAAHQQESSGDLTASKLNICPVAVNLSWTTNGAGGVAIFEDGNSQPIAGSATFNGNFDINNVSAGNHTYFLWEVDWGSGSASKIKQLDSDQVNVSNDNCNQAGPKDFSFNVTGLCVGDFAAYNFSNVSPALNGKPIYWNSTLNGSDTGEHSGFYNQTVSGGNFTLTASGKWQTPYHVGDWTKTAVIEGVSRSFSFTVRDCGGASPATPTVNSFTAAFSCPSNATVVWSTSNVNNVKVFVKANGGQEQDFANLASGNQTVNWMTPGSTAVFRLHGDGITDQFQTLSPAANLCAGTPTVNSFSATFQCPSNGTIVWSTTNANNVKVFVKSNNNAEQDFANLANGNQTVSWVQPGNVYVFRLHADGVADQFQTLSPQSNACGSTPTTLSCSANVATANIGDNVIFTAQGGSGSYSWQVPGSSIVSGNPFYVNFASAGAKTVTVTSTDGQSKTCGVTINSTTPGALSCAANVATANIGQSVTFNVTNGDASSIWATATNANAGTGTSFTTSFSTSGAQTISVRQPDGRHASCSVTINAATNPSTLSCTANVGTANIADNVIFTAQGGSGLYSWQVAGGSTVTGNPFIVNFASAGAKTVSVTSTDGQSKTCGVTINAPAQTTSAGNCNNSSISCNTNTNTNTSTNNNSTNSSNQNNNSNINGNNNTVTQSNQNCVNNSCNNTVTYSSTPNTVYITTTGATVPVSQYSQISITKSVRSQNSGGAFANSVSVNNGDVVQFEIVVSNNSNVTANNVRLSDPLSGSLSLISGSVLVDGSNVSDSNLYNNMYLGNIAPGQQKRINFQTRVNSGNNSSVQNTATASSDNAGSVNASAWVFVNGGSVQGGSVNLSYNKKAYNETKNVDATSVNANKEDYITYTLTVTNSGNTPANSFIISDDLSQVLPYADMADNGGGSLNGNTISYPGITVPAGGSVSRSFKVRVKFALADNLSYVMTNTYGNTVTVRINNPKVLGAFVAPKTGADTNAFVFSGFLTFAAFVVKKRKTISQLIFA